jgi:choline kinase
MRGIILAAGIASRLRPLTDSVPKCLLTVGGISILERTVTGLMENGITNLVIVTGYLGAQIRRSLEMRFPDLEVTYVHNAQYESTNNIYSLWLTKDFVIGHEVLLLDSDIVFDPRIIGLLLTSGHESCLAVRSDHRLSEEEIKVRVNPDGSIVAIGKEVNVDEAMGESIGIEKFGARSVGKMFQALDSMILRKKQFNVFYEAAFEEAIRSGTVIMPIDVGHYRCIEIDTAEDLERAARDVVPFLPSTAVPEKRS